MAYATGTGSNQQDFLDAVRSFALGLGWTINRWDTTAKRFYLSKGLCRVCLLWENVNISIYLPGATTTTTVSEGRIRGSLVGTIGAADDYSTFAGCTIKSGQLASASSPHVLMSGMQGPYVGWHLFSNASGDYIHAIVQTSADMYTFIGFGNADKGGLTHSGAAYMFADAGNYWYQASSASNAGSSSQHYQNKAGVQASLFVQAGFRNTSAAFHIYTENALPVGWTNSVGMAAGTYSATYFASSQTAMGIRSARNEYNKPSDYLQNGTEFRLGDPILTMSAPGYSPYVPMLGIPIIAISANNAQACAIGSVPDLRLINLSSLTPQQEFTLGADVWKVFPQLRQTSWSESNANGFLLPTSGQFGIALKKVA